MTAASIVTFAELDWVSGQNSGCKENSGAILCVFLNWVWSNNLTFSFNLTSLDFSEMSFLFWLKEWKRLSSLPFSGTMEQAEARAHRMGQKSAVDIHYLIAKGSMDERGRILINVCTWVTLNHWFAVCWFNVAFYDFDDKNVPVLKINHLTGP